MIPLPLSEFTSYHHIRRRRKRRRWDEMRWRFFFLSIQAAMARFLCEMLHVCCCCVVEAKLELPTPVLFEESIRASWNALLLFLFVGASLATKRSELTRTSLTCYVKLLHIILMRGLFVLVIFPPFSFPSSPLSALSPPSRWCFQCLPSPVTMAEKEEGKRKKDDEASNQASNTHPSLSLSADSSNKPILSRKRERERDWLRRGINPKSWLNLHLFQRRKIIIITYSWAEKKPVMLYFFFNRKKCCLLAVIPSNAKKKASKHLLILPLPKSTILLPPSLPVCDCGRERERTALNAYCRIIVVAGEMGEEKGGGGKPGPFHISPIHRSKGRRLFLSWILPEPPSPITIMSFTCFPCFPCDRFWTLFALVSAASATFPNKPIAKQQQEPSQHRSQKKAFLLPPPFPPRLIHLVLQTDRQTEGGEGERGWLSWKKKVPQNKQRAEIAAWTKKNKNRHSSKTWTETNESYWSKNSTLSSRWVPKNDKLCLMNKNKNNKNSLRSMTCRLCSRARRGKSHFVLFCFSLAAKKVNLVKRKGGRGQEMQRFCFPSLLFLQQQNFHSHLFISPKFFAGKLIINLLWKASTRPAKTFAGAKKKVFPFFSTHKKHFPIFLP